jgi:hypothetical protein
MGGWKPKILKGKMKPKKKKKKETYERCVADH